MFLRDNAVVEGVSSSPHVSGGVSGIIATLKKYLMFSPREWGCFYMNVTTRSEPLVLPT